MHILVVSDGFPEHDRNSADFRLVQFMAAFDGLAGVSFIAMGGNRQAERIGQERVASYVLDLERLGIEVITGSLRTAITTRCYDAIIFEWYFTAAPYIDDVRYFSPSTRIVTDSVDVVFNRLMAKARVSGLDCDMADAARVKQQELAVYHTSDLVLSVSDQDAGILKREDPGIRAYTIPNIHPLCDCIEMDAPRDKVLVFVGSKSDANNDAMLFFCNDVLPIILASVPDVTFRVVGTVVLPPLDESISRCIEVMGFVTDTTPCLAGSMISVAPLRYGGGMKGKVGEAMSMGLPVVATTIGAEGFNLTPGKDAIVADTAEDFAVAVIKLLSESELRKRIGLSGWQFIRENYSDEAVRRRVKSLIPEIAGIAPKRLAPWRRIQIRIKHAWESQISWRY